MLFRSCGNPRKSSLFIPLLRKRVDQNRNSVIHHQIIQITPTGEPNIGLPMHHCHGILRVKRHTDATKRPVCENLPPYHRPSFVSCLSLTEVYQTHRIIATDNLHENGIAILSVSCRTKRLFPRKLERKSLPKLMDRHQPIFLCWTTTEYTEFTE